jgi:hypothetical protein
MYKNNCNCWFTCFGGKIKQNHVWFGRLLKHSIFKIQSNFMPILIFIESIVEYAFWKGPDYASYQEKIHETMM